MNTVQSTTAAQFEGTRERLYRAGYDALAASDSQRALSAFGFMAALCPVDKRPWLGLAAATEQTGDWSLAASFYRLGQNVAESCPWPLIGQARVLGKLGRYAEARSLLDRAEDLTQDESTLRHVAQVRDDL
jgi:Flp pilus assembly protein TadD